MSSPSNRVRLTGPRDRTARRFEILPDASARDALSAELDLAALRKLRLVGELRPVGSQDWELDAMLGATVVQPCGITLEPVTTRIDEPVRRRYLADLGHATSAVEQEMPEETEEEPLPAVLDLEAVMVEVLSLALPAFPRAPGIEAGDVHQAGPPIEAISPDDRAALGALRRRLSDDES